MLLIRQPRIDIRSMSDVNDGQRIFGREKVPAIATMISVPGEPASGQIPEYKNGIWYAQCYVRRGLSLSVRT